MKLVEKASLSLALIAGLLISMLSLAAPKVSAAGATCFQNYTDKPTQVVNCGSQAALIERVSGIPKLATDTCYYIDEPAPTGGFIGTPTISSAAAGSTQCAAWQEQASTVSKSAPVCFEAKGSNVNVGTYTTGHLTSASVAKVSCSDNLLNKQPSSSHITSFQNGACYLYFASNGAIISEQCATLLQNLADADSSAKTPQGQPAQSPTAGSSASSSLNPSQEEAQIQKNCGSGKSPNQQQLQKCVQTNPLIQDINAAINLLSASVGIIVVIMVIIGGIQYMTASGNPQAVAVAKKRITNAIIALVSLIFMYSVLQWLIPGGIF